MSDIQSQDGTVGKYSVKEKRVDKIASYLPKCFFYKEKAFAWSVIKSEDVKALQAFSLFLRGCWYAIEVHIISPIWRKSMFLIWRPSFWNCLTNSETSGGMGHVSYRSSMDRFLDLVDFIERLWRYSPNHFFGKSRITVKRKSQDQEEAVLQQYSEQGQIQKVELDRFFVLPI